MKPIIVKESNKAKITELIRSVEGRCKARTIEYNDIEKAIARIEKKLNLPKSALTGTVASVDLWAQDFPKAYKYNAQSTQFTIVKVASGWKLTRVSREDVRKSGCDFYVDLSNEAKERIIRRYEVFYN